MRPYADMAELADAHGSGPCERKFLQVRLLLSAPDYLILIFFQYYEYKISSVIYKTKGRIIVPFGCSWFLSHYVYTKFKYLI